jgi:hypothetical protein
MPKSRIAVGLLRRVFNFDRVRDFDIHLAQLCVLYEDLRIETAAIWQRSMPELDVLDPANEHPDEPEKIGRYRRQYFLRRSIATILEFAHCLASLRECVEFKVIRNNSPEAAQVLDDAVRFFTNTKALLRTARNSVGAHFGYASAKYAIGNLEPEATGKLEFEITDGHINVKLHFSAELAAIAFCSGLPGKTNPQKITTAIECLDDGYRHATAVVQVMVGADLMPRFSR